MSSVIPSLQKGKGKVKLRGKVRTVYKQMGKAIYDYRMLAPEDRVLVAVSGGADSLALLKLFLMRKRRVPFNFKIIACFVDTNFVKVDKEALIKYFKDNGIDYIVKELEIKKENRNCFWCSWSRRKILFETAKRFSCNKIALGHNLDDITETILMNMFFFSQISSAPPALDMFSGRVKLIRPLAYLKKKDVLEFAQQLLLPYAIHSCVYGEGTRRAKIKKIIKDLEGICPEVKKNIFRSLGKIRKDYLV